MGLEPKSWDRESHALPAESARHPIFFYFLNCNFEPYFHIGMIKAFLSLPVDKKLILGGLSEKEVTASESGWITCVVWVIWVSLWELYFFWDSSLTHSSWVPSWIFFNSRFSPSLIIIKSHDKNNLNGYYGFQLFFFSSSLGFHVSRVQNDQRPIYVWLPTTWVHLYLLGHLENIAALTYFSLFLSPTSS